MKIFAVGMNYADHNKELTHPSFSPEPTLLMKSVPLLKIGKPFLLPHFTDALHY